MAVMGQGCLEKITRHAALRLDARYDLPRYGLAHTTTRRATALRTPRHATRWLGAHDDTPRYGLTHATTRRATA